jgi:hypothetical protein
MSRLEQFRQEPAPIDMSTFKKMAEFWPYEIANNLCDAQDDVKTKFAEMFDLHATILPDASRNGYHVDLMASPYYSGLWQLPYGIQFISRHT